MKSIKLFLFATVVMMAASSCVENSEKYQALLAQRDSLTVVAQNYTQTLDILNEVEAGFNSISEIEGTIRPQASGVEGQSQSKKQQLATKVNQIKEILAQNRDKIALLQAQLSRSGQKNSTLAKTVERLENELTEKSASIESLQAELAKKNVKIEELGKAIDGLNADVAQLNEVSSDQQKTISMQDQDMNRVWYVLGTTKELKESQILSGNGIFRAKTVMDKEFDKSLFTQADLRQLVSIPTYSRRPKLLSSHPEGSYELLKGDDKLVTIQIIDPAKFWSVSKYLVVQK